MAPDKEYQEVAQLTGQLVETLIESDQPDLICLNSAVSTLSTFLNVAYPDKKDFRKVIIAIADTLIEHSVTSSINIVED